MRMKRILTLAAVVVSLLGVAADRAPVKDPKPGKPNRLARETSPYLLQHAHNPVDWFPWGEEAFAKAKKEGKLVFLSIGYSSCHWCHVMEKESFADAEVAKTLNELFVCVKVDREERPDIDHIYMTALTVMGRNGGWPLSMFLTPDGKPFFGGTYWPKDDKKEDGETIKGFKSLVKLVDEAWKSNKKDILERADKFAADADRELAGLARMVPLFEINRELVTQTLDGIVETFDSMHGGFGSPDRGFRGTKFPLPPKLMLLHEEAVRGSKPAARTLDVTLRYMARGGIYDHLGGGFHRYSTERTWTVPHFEKMLYDNAQLVEVYSLGYQRTKNELYRRVVKETLGFIERELTSPEGAFYSALDADSEGEEGRFYVWTPKDMDGLFDSKAEIDLFTKVYGDGGLNFEGKYRILCLKRPLADIAEELKVTEEKLLESLEPIKKRMLAVRAKRPRPFLDTKILTAWNGQMIAGYAAAGQVLGEKKYLDAATKAADFLLTNLRTKEGRLLRTYGAAPGQKAQARLNAYLDDYAYLIHGLLALHDATGDKKWLDESKKLADVMVKNFEDEKPGGFFYTSNDHEKFFARAKDQYDGVQPCGNSMAARNFVRLAQKTKDQKYQKLAFKTIRSLAMPLKTSPTSLCTLASALGMYLEAEKKK